MVAPEKESHVKKRSALDAWLDAQKIVLGPIIFQASRLLRDLGILKRLRESRTGLTLDEIAGSVEVSDYGVRVLVEGGLAAGMIRMEDDRYFLTPTGIYLLDDRTARVNMDFVQECCFQAAYYLEDSIRDGKPVGLHKTFSDSETIYTALPEFPDSARESWLAWDHHYSDAAFSQALPIVFGYEPQSILDIGGNTGKWAIQCASYSADVTITILDHPGVVALAKKSIRENGLEERILTQGVELLDDSTSFPKGFDAIWMSQFLVCFSEEQIAILLERAFEAMAPHTKLFILDNFWDRQKNDVATFCLQSFSLYFSFLANGYSRMYKASDITRMIEEAGMKVEEVSDHLGVCSSLIICAKC